MWGERCRDTEIREKTGDGGCREGEKRNKNVRMSGDWSQMPEEELQSPKGQSWHEDRRERDIDRERERESTWYHIPLFRYTLHFTPSLPSSPPRIHCSWISLCFTAPVGFSSCQTVLCELNEYQDTVRIQKWG